jgi:hypothetical protein
MRRLKSWQDRNQTTCCVRLKRTSSGRGKWRVFGVDQLFTDDIQTMVAEGRFVSPEDLIRMVEFFVEQPEIGGKLTRDEKILVCIACA